jgi:signal transduction histidine kinase
MVVLRRLAVSAGALLVTVHYAFGVLPVTPEPVLLGILVVFSYNEGGAWLLARRPPEQMAAVVHAQIAADVLATVTLLHFTGGIANPSLALSAIPLLATGAVLPLGQALVHVGLLTCELGALAFAEASGILLHRPNGLFDPGAHARPEVIGMVLVSVTVMNALFTYASHHLSALLRSREGEARSLASERGDLLSRNLREADRVRALLASNERVYGRVRALLDVAQHVSGSHSVSELLNSVCDTTVALVRVSRVEIFLWDGNRQILELAAARGLTKHTIDGEDRHYTADVPIVAQLRAGQVVDFGAAPVQALATTKVETPFRRGFAAPMVCRGSFEGALFVGYGDENTDELMELVQGIARQAAVALVNVRALEQQQEDAEVSRGLLDISQAMSACLDEEALWRLLVRGATQVLDLPWGMAARFDEQAGAFTMSAACGLPNAALAGLAHARFPIESVPMLQELISNREVIVHDEAHPRHPGLPEPWQLGAWIAIPLFRGKWMAGFVALGDTKPRRFARRHLRLAEGVGHQASIALDNARLVAGLEAADRLKSEFVSTMSHELRTPLNVIIGFSEMLREGAAGSLNPQQLDLVQRLDSRGRELLELIEETLLVGRLEAGRVTIDVVPIALGELVTALQASTAGLPRPPGVVVEWEAPEAHATPIKTDRAKLALVIRNLVSNALKFTNQGKVVVRLRVRNDGLVIDVRDTGIGIDAEHLPIIFEMFRQVDGSSTRRHGGVGLGLYIVKQYVARLGGTVDVRSVVGEGSTFRVVLPGVTRDEGKGGQASGRRLVAA